MAVGFVTSRPGSRTCASDSLLQVYDWVWTLKATAPGSGQIEISEIGGWLYKSSSDSQCKFAILEHDSANNCPSATQVADSLTSEVNISNASIAAVYGSYGTKPKLTGGVYYHLAFFVNSNPNAVILSWDSTGGSSVQHYYATYPTWPADSVYHGKVNAYKPDLYAVYADVVPLVPMAHYYNMMRGN